MSDLRNAVRTVRAAGREAGHPERIGRDARTPPHRGRSERQRGVPLALPRPPDKPANAPWHSAGRTAADSAFPSSAPGPHRSATSSSKPRSPSSPRPSATTTKQPPPVWSPRPEAPGPATPPATTHGDRWLSPSTSTGRCPHHGRCLSEPTDGYRPPSGARSGACAYTSSQVSVDKAQIAEGVFLLPLT